MVKTALPKVPVASIGSVMAASIFFDVMARAGDGDAWGVGIDADDLISAGEIAGDPGMDFYFLCHSRIEG